VALTYWRLNVDYIADISKRDTAHSFEWLCVLSVLTVLWFVTHRVFADHSLFFWYQFLC
jgi:hypothetical protein